MNKHYLITAFICVLCVLISAYLLWPSFVETFDGAGSISSSISSTPPTSPGYNLTQTNADGTTSHSAPFRAEPSPTPEPGEAALASESQITVQDTVNMSKDPNEVVLYNPPSTEKTDVTLKSSNEPINSPAATSQVITIYKELLDRDPNGTELSGDVAAINSGMLNSFSLRRRIMDSVEYSNSIKLQSNSINPELSKMISDQNMMHRISEIYKAEIGSTIKQYILLPLRDIFMLLEYNEWSLRAMFRDASYKKFENDIKSTPDLNNPQMMDIFNRYFNIINLKKKGEAIAKVEADKQNAPDGAHCSTLDRGIEYVDTNIGDTVSSIMSQANDVFNKDTAAENGLDSSKSPQWLKGFSVDEGMASRLTEANTTPDFYTTANQKSVKIPIQNGNTVLIPGMAWSVPGYRPPVCTTAGQPLLIQPMMNDSKLLLGTPVDEAANQTSVGSIMPPFDYQAYVNIPQ